METMERALGETEAWRKAQEVAGDPATDNGVGNSRRYVTWTSGGNRECMFYGWLVEGWGRHKWGWMGSTESTRSTRFDGTKRGQ
ncbi:unnamed protein product [Cochlearia groenlandica]